MSYKSILPAESLRFSPKDIVFTKDRVCFCPHNTATFPYTMQRANHRRNEQRRYSRSKYDEHRSFESHSYEKTANGYIERTSREIHCSRREASTHERQPHRSRRDGPSTSRRRSRTPPKRQRPRSVSSEKCRPAQFGQWRGGSREHCGSQANQTHQKPRESGTGESSVSRELTANERRMFDKKSRKNPPGQLDRNREMAQKEVFENFSGELRFKGRLRPVLDIIPTTPTILRLQFCLTNR